MVAGGSRRNESSDALVLDDGDVANSAALEELALLVAAASAEQASVSTSVPTTRSAGRAPLLGAVLIAVGVGIGLLALYSRNGHVVETSVTRPPAVSDAVGGQVSWRLLDISRRDGSATTCSTWAASIQLLGNTRYVGQPAVVLIQRSGVADEDRGATVGARNEITVGVDTCTRSQPVLALLSVGGDANVIDVPLSASSSHP